MQIAFAMQLQHANLTVKDLNTINFVDVFQPSTPS
jgi:hypothetical protein